MSDEKKLKEGQWSLRSLFLFTLICGCFFALIYVMIRDIPRMRSGAARAWARNSMKQITLGIMMYNEVNDHCPGRVVLDENEKTDSKLESIDQSLS